MKGLTTRILRRNKIKYKDSFHVEGGDFKSAGEVSIKIKDILKGIGLPSDTTRKAAIVTCESEINIVSYARKGVIQLRVTPDSVIISAIDEGQGIPDIEMAMKEGYSTASDIVREMGFGAGMGLSNIKKFSDDFEIISEVDKGTRLKMIIKIGNGSEK